MKVARAQRAKPGGLAGARHKASLVVLFVPSVGRDGRTPVAQREWVRRALKMFGRVFGGATAYPRAEGVWRDDARAGELVYDHPVVVHCYTSSASLANAENLRKLGEFCRAMGRETDQGEVGLVIDGEYLAITEFQEE